jgi:hypothetical protein
MLKLNNHESIKNSPIPPESTIHYSDRALSEYRARIAGASRPHHIIHFRDHQLDIANKCPAAKNSSR